MSVLPFFACIYDRANKQALSPRSTHKLPIRCPSIRPSQAYDKQLISPARSTGWPSTKYSFNGPIHDAFFLS
jgi:hypothetical protein